MTAPAITTSAPTQQAATRHFDLAAALKDAATTALMMLGLSIPILAYKTDQSGADLFLTPRWGLVAIMCAIIFGFRLVLHAYTASRSYAKATPSPRQATEAVDAMPSAFQKVSRFGVPFFLGIALAFPLLIYLIQGGLTESRYWVDLGILMLTYVMLGWGLNIVVGLAGLLDLGYVAFYAVGAYSYALLSTTFGLSFWICLPLAGILAAFWGMILGFPVLRLRGDYLAIVTLAFGEIIRLVLINWVDLTNGGAGISSIPRATFFGIPFTNGEGGFASLFGLEFSPMHRIIFLYYLILVLALITNFVTMRLRRLPVGRAWEALREDEIACRSLGHQHHEHQAHGLRHRARCSAASRGRSSRCARASSARRASPSWNPRSSWRSWCWAAWARSSAWPSPRWRWWAAPRCCATSASCGPSSARASIPTSSASSSSLGMVAMMNWRRAALISEREPPRS
jgi:branched-chain amino acid transport system permease protein